MFSQSLEDLRGGSGSDGGLDGEVSKEGSLAYVYLSKSAYLRVLVAAI